MAAKLKIVILLGIIVVIAIIVGYSQFAGKQSEQGAEVIQPVTSATTDNIDQTANAILKDMSDNATIILEEGESDVNLANTDSQAIDDFGQLYDENEF